MTPNDAAAVLEHIVEKRGAEWVATNWGLDREQLARWYEGQEELPPEMVFAMRVWVSAVRKPRADVGCFEDRDHPPKPTIKWDDAVAWTYDGGQITIRMAEDQGDARRMSLMDLMAGRAKISVELNEQGEWKGKWKPVDADDHPPEVPEEVTETGLDAVSTPTVGRGEIRMDEGHSAGGALWDAYRLGTRQFHETGLTDLEDYAWQAAGEQCDLIEALDQFEWLPEIMPVAAWDKDANWQSLIRVLAGYVRSAIEEDDR
jgi:hypothetical protein